MKKIFAIVVAMMLVAITAIPAFAAVSPTAPVQYSVTITNPDKGGTAYASKTTVDADGVQHSFFKYSAPAGQIFVKWTVSGDPANYEIVSDPTTGELELIIKGEGVVVTPVFEKKPSSSQDTTSATSSNGSNGSNNSSVSKDNSTTSPQTGSNTTTACVVIVLGLVACGAVATKLVKKN